ncbi:protein-export chaperone SecB [Macrococcus capreoli]|uniref:protein-export chaperone SecB n=1 Tax=Macrococcus capreoli TaxID=2982690 RepID=UPI003EE49D07
MKAQLNFLKYEVEEIVYKVNTLIEVEEDSLNPELICNVMHPKNDNSKFIVKLGLEFGDESLDNTNSYLRCVVAGVFEQGVASEFDLTPNAIAILFPYLRSIISDITSKGSRTPIILPPINVHEFLNNAEKTNN